MKQVIEKAISQKPNPVVCKSYDVDEKKWFKAELKLEGDNFRAKDIDPNSPFQGMEWVTTEKELLNPKLWKP